MSPSAHKKPAGIKDTKREKPEQNKNKPAKQNQKIKKFSRSYSMPLIGAHVSIAGGVDKAAERAKKQGCEAMQIFVQSPQTFKTPQTTPEEVKSFLFSLKKYHIARVYVHAPYLINLASPNNKIRYGSIGLIRKNLERASMLGCCALMTHIGSYGGGDKKTGIETVVRSLVKILNGYSGSCQLLLELSAGTGGIIGSRFDEMKTILEAIPAYPIGICLDTAHIFASGYSLEGRANISKTIREFEKTIGLSKTKVLHLNDSFAPFGSKKDRHADIGDGEIGIENFKLLINHPELRAIDMILETPGTGERRLKDIKLLKSF